MNTLQNQISLLPEDIQLLIKTGAMRKFQKNNSATIIQKYFRRVNVFNRINDFLNVDYYYNPNHPETAIEQLHDHVASEVFESLTDENPDPEYVTTYDHKEESYDKDGKHRRTLYFYGNDLVAIFSKYPTKIGEDITIQFTHSDTDNITRSYYENEDHCNLVELTEYSRNSYNDERKNKWLFLTTKEELEPLMKYINMFPYQIQKEKNRERNYCYIDYEILM